MRTMDLTIDLTMDLTIDLAAQEERDCLLDKQQDGNPSTSIAYLILNQKPSLPAIRGGAKSKPITA